MKMFNQVPQAPLCPTILFVCVPYVPYVSSRLMCPSALLPYVPFVSYMLYEPCLPCVPLCFVWLTFHLCINILRTTSYALFVILFILNKIILRFLVRSMKR